MTASPEPRDPGGACARCLRRSWLLGELCVPLEYCSRDPRRLLDVLALEDRELLRALGGRRRHELERRLDELSPEQVDGGVEAVSVCRHDSRFPRGLAGPTAPTALFTSGGATRLAALTAVPVVAIVGAMRASDYGSEAARGLARGLSASGVTVASTVAAGIPMAAQAGSHELPAPTIVAIAGGLDTPTAARRRATRVLARARGCAVSELPPGCAARRFGATSAERVLAELADVVLVVEAEQGSAEMACADLARARGSILAAIPGRIGSPLAEGPHELLRRGAALVRTPEDLLELLGHAQLGPAPLRVQPSRPAPWSHATVAAVHPRLRELLHRVAAGADTPERICGRGGRSGEVLLGLSELELMGLLTRGDGGRYVPRAMPAGSFASVVEFGD